MREASAKKGDTMSYKSLREFISRLEEVGDLVRVDRPVSTVLEMTEIQTRLLAEGGPAVIFEKPVMPDGSISDIPVMVNLFGTVKRVAMGVTMGVDPQNVGNNDDSAAAYRRGVCVGHQCVDIAAG